MLTPLEIHASDEVRAALAGLGRTEDVAFSADGRRAALACFGTDRIVVLDLDLPASAEGPVVVHGLTALHSPWLKDPHGVAFLSDDVVAVANRVLDVVALRLPPPHVGVQRLDVEPVLRIGVDDVGRARTPGSLTALQVAPDIVEVLVCNNYVDCVTRHVVDVRTMRAAGDEVFLDVGISHPDGITVSNDRRVLAVSIRQPSVVQLYQNTPQLGAQSEPIGTLLDVMSSHGIAFTDDDEYILLADGAAPLVHVYRCGTRRGSNDHGWGGDHHPVASYQVMGDAAFARGPVAHDDGGAKGVCIDPSQRFVAVSAEVQPLAFFALAAFLPDRQRITPDVPPADDHTRATLLRELHRAKRLGTYARELESVVAEQDERIRVLEEWAEGLVKRMMPPPRPQ